MILTLWAVFTVSFLLMHSVPGSPFSSERSVPPAIERQLMQKHNLDAPLHEQYLADIRRIVTK
jgi:oligopeptide transport system permease protein